MDSCPRHEVKSAPVRQVGGPVTACPQPDIVGPAGLQFWAAVAGAGDAGAGSFQGVLFRPISGRVCRLAPRVRWCGSGEGAVIGPEWSVPGLLWTGGLVRWRVVVRQAA